MKVFKFGGASVKDAVGVKNASKIIQGFGGEKTIVVVSAMGKMTNLLEKVLLSSPDEREELLTQFFDFHKNIVKDLGLEAELTDLISESVNAVNDSFSISDEFERYDAVVARGEFLSTAIISSFIESQGTRSKWFDVREVIKTSEEHKNANIDWVSSSACKHKLESALVDFDVIVTQGFIGSSNDGKTTTLGREGSDFSAAILAYLTDSHSVTIWKDVPGMLNADPRYFDNTVMLEQISYREAIELAYFGASVIHPKTVKPLQNRGIPLYVKSFLHPQENGSVIKSGVMTEPLVPSYIFKRDQVLISISPQDYSFVAETHLSEIFKVFAENKINVNLMQNSALNFSAVFDRKAVNLESLVEDFGEKFIVKFNTDLELVTVRHYDEETFAKFTEEREIFIEQKSRNTLRLVLK